MFQRLHKNSYPGLLVFSLLRRCGGVPKVWVVVSQNPRGSMGWCSKSWGGAPKSCPRILDGVVFQKDGWCSKKLFQNGVVFEKLGWCSKKLSQNPHGSMGWCSKSWGCVPKSCPRIPTLYTTEDILLLIRITYLLSKSPSEVGVR